jgi:heme/copper-type cytochrome/quinol oxidase subunit 3
MLCIIEAATFAVLIAAYLYLRLQVDVWPGAGVQLPHWELPTLALIPMTLSCVGSYWSGVAAKKDQRAGMILALSMNLVFAGVALVMRVIEWRTFNFTWSTDAHGSIVWTILGLHTLDYIGGMLETLVFLVLIAAGRYGKRERLGIHVDSIVWYFVVLIWIPLYAVVYWGPRFLGGTIQP